LVEACKEEHFAQQSPDLLSDPLAGEVKKVEERKQEDTPSGATPATPGEPTPEGATPTGAEEDLEQSRVGTPFYLAPELWKDRKYSKASDMWALGVILYELCCQAYPFPASEMEELERKVLTEKIQKHPNHVNSEFVEIFTKLLRKDPAKRPCIEEIIYSNIFQSKAQ